MDSTHSISGVVLRTESADSRLSKRSETVGVGSVFDPGALSPVDQVEAKLGLEVPDPPVYIKNPSSDRGMIGRSSKVYTTDDGASNSAKELLNMAEPAPTEIGMSNLSPRQDTGQVAEASDTLTRTLHQVSLMVT